MLRIIGSTEVENCTLEVSDYVPISFRCAEVISLSPLYWRTGDFKKSLLEIGLNQNTGAICKVTVTLIANYLKKTVGDFSEASIHRACLPICDISGWPSDRFRDESFAFTALIAEDSVSIWVAPEAPIGTIYEFSQIRFAADGQGYLRLVQFNDVNPETLGYTTNSASRSIFKARR